MSALTMSTAEDTACTKHVQATASRSTTRRAFTPARTSGNYGLPHEIEERLKAALGGFRNRTDAYALALFLARFWTAPARLGHGFPVDRRALANHRELGLTEARVRGGLSTLEKIGFLARGLETGPRYKRTEKGPRRNAVTYHFGATYAPQFRAANNRATAAQERQKGERRTQTPDRGKSPSATALGALASNLRPQRSNSPIRSAAQRTVLMGEIAKAARPRQPTEPDAALEAALARLKEAAGIRDQQEESASQTRKGSQQ